MGEWKLRATGIFWSSIMLPESAVIFSAKDCQEHETPGTEKSAY